MYGNPPGQYPQGVGFGNGGPGYGVPQTFAHGGTGSVPAQSAYNTSPQHASQYNGMSPFDTNMGIGMGSIGQEYAATSKTGLAEVFTGFAGAAMGGVANPKSSSLLSSVNGLVGGMAK